MEHSEPQEHIELLPRSVVDRNLAIAEVLRFTTDDSQAVEHVQLLSEKCHAYIGMPSELTSELFAWQAHRLTSEGIQNVPIMDLALLSSKQTTGIFTGFNYYPDEENRKILHYQLDAGYDEQTGTYMTVSAPVASSILRIERNSADAGDVFEDKNDEEAEIQHALTLLMSIKDSDFRTEFEGFQLDIDALTFDNLETIHAVANMATWLLGHDAVKESVEHQEAIIGLIDILMKDSGSFVFEGFEIVPVKTETGPGVSYEAVECTGEILNVIAVENYGDGEQGDTLQPAFIIWDVSIQKEFMIPMKQISLMQIDTSQPIAYYDKPRRVSVSGPIDCSPSVNRYREKYISREH